LGRLRQGQTTRGGTYSTIYSESTPRASQSTTTSEK
jgi:hypothetical protein